MLSLDALIYRRHGRTPSGLDTLTCFMKLSKWSEEILVSCMRSLRQASALKAPSGLARAPFAFYTTLETDVPQSYQVKQNDCCNVNMSGTDFLRATSPRRYARHHFGFTVKINSHRGGGSFD